MKSHSGSIRRAAGVGVLVAVAMTAACDTSSSPTANDGVEPIVGLAVGDPSINEFVVTPGEATACIFYPGSVPDGIGSASTYTATADGGDWEMGSFLLYNPSNRCYEVWNDDGAAGAQNVGVTLTATPAGLVLDSIATRVGVDGDNVTVTWFKDVNSASASIPDGEGANFWFKFSVEETPPGDGQGCTPGYWRQPHHYDSWEGYAPGDLFEDVFDGDHFTGETLGEVVWARGGGINALARHAVAALLNASSTGVDYDLTPQDVIDAYNDAQDGDRNEMNAQKDIFEGFNEQGCPLN